VYFRLDTILEGKVLIVTLSLLELIRNIYNFLIQNPLTLLLTPAIWFGTTIFCEKYIGKASLKTVGFCLIVALSVTIGVVLLLG